MDGDTQERAFMATLRGHDFVPMRSPGSGTGDWDQPDVLAGRQGVILAGEVKSGGPPSNVQEHEVDALKRFADAFWAAALVVVRYKGDRTFYLVPPAQMDRTPSGHYSIPSSPADLPWAIALPFTRNDDGVVPKTDDRDVDPGGDADDGDPRPRILYATDETTPGLSDWLDALTARQQGFQVRRGIVDLQRDTDPDAADVGGDD